MVEVIEIGFIDKGTGKHESNIVYSIRGAVPCITASYGVKQPPAMFVVRKNGTKDKDNNPM